MEIPSRRKVGVCCGIFSFASFLLSKSTGYRILWQALTAISFLAVCWPKRTQTKSSVKSVKAVQIQPSYQFNPPISDRKDLICVIQNQKIPFNQWFESKKKTYTWLVEKQPLKDKIRFATFNVDSKAALQMCFPEHSKLQLTVHKEGVGFRYPPSTQTTMHWNADFADPILGGFYSSYLCRQEEILCLEYPGLIHLFSELHRNQHSRLNGNDVALIENVTRYGTLHTKGIDGKQPSVYGTSFVANSIEKSFPGKYIKRADPPFTSNIFAIAAPEVRGFNKNKPYRKVDLEKFFLRAYTAFGAIRQQHPKRKIVIHTGNWGCGAFGNDFKVAAITQLAAATLAGIDQLEYYPWRNHPAQEFNRAKTLFDKLFTPGKSVNDFLTHLTTHAKSYDLLYRERQLG